MSSLCINALSYDVIVIESFYCEILEVRLIRALGFLLLSPSPVWAAPGNTLFVLVHTEVRLSAAGKGRGATVARSATCSPAL